MGALIIAAQCSSNCKDCFNKHLLTSTLYGHSASSIIRRIKRNPFNDGIILGGLEWSEQPSDAVLLLEHALSNNLQVMLYTGLTEEQLYERIPERYLHDCYIKFGKYDSRYASNNYKSYGVTLASTNQYIRKKD